MVVRTSDYCSVETRAAILAERIAGGEYPEIAARHGVSMPAARWICYRAVRKGLATDEQIRRRAVEVKRLTDDEYIAMYMAKSIVSPDGCVLWQGWCNRKGYAQSSYHGKPWALHRLIYTLKIGPIPPGMLACHTCDRRNCWNEAHLFLGTEADNNRDCGNKGRHHNSVKTHCKYGHEYTPENVYLKKGPGTLMRACLECQRIRFASPKYIAWRNAYARRRRAKLKAQKAGSNHVG